VRCIRCAPMEYEQSPQARYRDDGLTRVDAPPLHPPPSDVPLRLAEMQARFMDGPPPPPAP
jgi:hypothetical protein